MEAAKPAAAARKAPSVPAAPKPSKGELRAQVEKLERTVATLRARSREAVRAAKQAAAKINELEMQLAERKEPAPEPEAAAPRTARQARKLAAAAPPTQAAKPVRHLRVRRMSPERDPEDAAPSGVTGQGPLHQQAPVAFEIVEATPPPADD